MANDKDLAGGNRISQNSICHIFLMGNLLNNKWYIEKYIYNTLFNVKIVYL